MMHALFFDLHSLCTDAHLEKKAQKTTDCHKLSYHWIKAAPAIFELLIMERNKRVANVLLHKKTHV